MRNLKITAACLLLALTAADIAPAQQGRPGRGANPTVQTRERQRGGDASDQIMRHAGKEVAQAREILEHALPIYQGHRAAAIKETREADKEIALGLKFDRKNERGGANSEGKDNESATKYGREQVERSNSHLKKAAGILTHAKTQLQGAAHDYDGHRVKAINEIDEALKQIQIALPVVDRKP